MGFSAFLNSVRNSQSGNVFFALFGAVALVGVVGASSMQIMKGPVRSMSEVTKRTVAENNMIASAKLASSLPHPARPAGIATMTGSWNPRRLNRRAARRRRWAAGSCRRPSARP
jgi:hypothetical protein